MILNRLLARLHRIFNKNPLNVPVLSITGPNVLLTIADLTAVFSKPGAVVAQQIMAADGSVWVLVPNDLGSGNFSASWQSIKWNGSASASAIQTADGTAWQLVPNDLGGGVFAVSWQSVTAPASGMANMVADQNGNAWELLATANGDGTYRIDLVMFGSLELINGAQIDFSAMTMSQLAIAITTLGFTAMVTNAAYSTYPARGLFETAENISAGPTSLLYPTSVFYKEMQTSGWALDEQHARIQIAKQQLDLKEAQDEWLDYWGSFFNVPRMPGEIDSIYGPRIFWQMIRPTQNNVALEIIVKDALGIDITITDAMTVLGTLTTEMQANAPGRFIMDVSLPSTMTSDQKTAATLNAMALVRKYKAGGFDFLQQTSRSNIMFADMATVSETIDLTLGTQVADSPQPGVLVAGAGWIAGTPGLVAGNNKAMQEQVCVTAILYSDGSVLSVNLSGG